jgi:hypothetical protein
VHDTANHPPTEWLISQQAGLSTSYGIRRTCG